MPNQPSADKEVLSFQVPRTLKRRLVKLAKSRGEALSETVIAVLTNATIDIELTPEDYQSIAEAVQRRHIASAAKRSSREARKGGEG